MGDEISISISGHARVNQVIGKIENRLDALRDAVDDAAESGDLAGDAAAAARARLAEAESARRRPNEQERNEALVRALRGLAETVRSLPELSKDAHKAIDLVQSLQ
ncbi:hypothetical protein [Dactylosporangium darangshiense]|uniref:Uncharacterized protein n=1 Tax=Dactylosporangium darangshiense TaxID=579108 RepID=A0ABP8DK46_9ACTN